MFVVFMCHIKGEFMENERNGLSFRDVWYLLKKYLILELAIILAAVAIGAAYSVLRRDVFRAEINVMIQAKLDQGGENTLNNVPYTNYYIENICDFFSTDIVTARASEKCGDVVSGKAVGTTSEENKWIVSVRYSDYSPDDAKKKLLAVIEAAEELAQLTDDNGEYVYFQGYVKLPVLGEAKVVPVNSTFKTVLISGIAGIVLALAVAFIMYYANDKITQVERIETITGKKNIQTITLEKKKRGSTEEIDRTGFNLEKLAETLVFLKDGEKEKVCQIQSSINGEGKSTVAANLSIALGRIRKKTLVIECDFRKPTIHRYFRIEKALGMTDYFKGDKTFSEVVKKTDFENVDIITCGERFDNPAIIFMSGKFGALIEKARENYDFVILDCPPAGLVTEYMAISPFTDFTVLVVGCDKVSSVVLKNTVADLKASGVDIVGTVFNFAPERRNNAYYYYGEKTEGKAETAQ